MSWWIITLIAVLVAIIIGLGYLLYNIADAISNAFRR